ncbi:MAG: hypothetical protein AAF682_13740 [Planctomycetota bacterium]
MFVRPRKQSFGLLTALALFGGLTASCSGGGGSSPGQGGFQLVNISVAQGQIWPINKRIELEFNADVDLDSVIAGSTLNLKSVDGSGSAAFYEVDYRFDAAAGTVDRTTLVIQPFCPVQGDLSDAGLVPGGVEYELFVPGQTSLTPNTITSVNGVSLKLSQTRVFFTPDSTDPAAVFDDTEIGPPSFVPDGTYVRLGDGSELPFVFTGSSYELPDILPLNLYSDAESTVSFLVQLNQSVDPSDSNLNDSRVRIEFLDGSGTWQPFQTLVELETNCPLDAPGAILRLTPNGILPQDTSLRVTLASGFTDLVGETNLSDQTDFFAPTQIIDFTSLAPADGGADEVFEDFMLSGDQVGSFEDIDANFDTPPADWEEGTLTAAFDFQGTGGPGGNFDWHTPPITINFSTDFTEITGGPDGSPSLTIPVVGGVLDVEDLLISAGTFLRVAPGTNPLTIIATGDVTIEGTIDVSGFDAKQIGTLFTAWLPEPGASGPAGGASGGTSSFLTSSSTSRGGFGDGPFGIQNAGGNGGETGYDGTTDKQRRRGAGGGGGRFAPDFSAEEGMTAEMGGTGHPQGKGAESGGELPAQGGPPGLGAFLDGDTENDFWGKRGIYDGDGNLQEILTGELASPWAGYGGGAGGDALNKDAFPTIPFGPPNTTDKKGCGGGGGGGQLRIIALGRIIFKDGGRILIGGGDGATGENVLGFDHIAGSSGGGSGGHVILESATQIDFTDGGANQVPQEYVQARGGEGGIPKIPEPWSGGGNGGPGVVQLHVPNSNPATAIGTSETDDIRIPFFSSLDELTKPTGQVLIPSFGARSKGRSRWIPMGEAAQVPGGGVDPIFFSFDGIDSDPMSPTAGQVLVTGDDVDPLAPILGPETLGSAAPAAFVDADGFTLVLSSASIDPLMTDPGTPSADIYLRNPSLLKNFLLRLVGPSSSAEFDVASATYADAGEVLRLTVDTAGSSLEAFITAAGGPASVDFELVPRFFRTQTGLFRDTIPSTAFVKVLFQATGTGPDGLPDTENPVVDWTPDIGEFNTVPAGGLDFYRFEVEFNLDATGAGLTVDTVPVSLNFLRTPFSF